MSLNIQDRHAWVCTKWKGLAIHGLAKKYQVIFDTLRNLHPTRFSNVTQLSFSNPTNLKQVRTVYHTALKDILGFTFKKGDASLISFTRDLINKGLLIEAEDLIQSIYNTQSGTCEKTYALYLLTEAWVNKRDLKKAEQVANLIKDEDETSKQYRHLSLFSIAESYRKRGEFEEAYRLYCICPLGARINCLEGMRDLTSDWIKEKRSGKALLIAKSIPVHCEDGSVYPHSKTEAILEVAKALAEERKFIAAINVLKLIPNEYPHKKTVQNNFIVEFLKLIAIEEQFAEFDQVLKILQESNLHIGEPPRFGRTYVHELCDRKQFKLAETAVMFLIQNPDQKDEALVLIGQALLHNEQHEEVDRILGLIGNEVLAEEVFSRPEKISEDVHKELDKAYKTISGNKDSSAKQCGFTERFI